MEVTPRIRRQDLNREPVCNAHKDQFAVDTWIKIAASHDLHISPIRADGITYVTPTWNWFVNLEGALYVRAHNGRASHWYRMATSHKAGRITASGVTQDVIFVPVGGPINDLIDVAYRTKYCGSRYLNAITGSLARSTTIKVLPKTADRSRTWSRADFVR